MPPQHVRRKQAREDDEHDRYEDRDSDVVDHDGADGRLPQRLAKNLVRFALSQELQRTVMKRAEMTSKATKGGRFNEVFALAQNDLREVFGMELAELPMRDRTSLASRRAAQTAERPAKSSKSYILTSILDARYRDADIVECHGFKQQTYDGFVGFVVAVIYLNGRSLPAPKLLRYLGRLNADEWMPLDRTERALQLMVKHGYIVRTKDNDGDETSYEYHLGPRGKVEIGPQGVLHLIRTVYGDDQIEDLEAKFKRNVGVEMITTIDEPFPMSIDDGDSDDARHRKKNKKKPAAGRGQRRVATSDEDDEDEAAARRRSKGKQRARAAPDSDSDDEEEEEEDD